MVGNNRKVHILIDSGSTHNFVHFGLVDKYSGFVDYTTPLRVLVDSGARVQTRGIIPQFQL